jgi:hypothetical protein
VHAKRVGKRIESRLTVVRGIADPLAAGIGIPERAIADVGVSVQVLGVTRLGDERIRADEPPQRRVVPARAILGQSDQILCIAICPSYRQIQPVGVLSVFHQPTLPGVSRSIFLNRSTSHYPR